MSKLPVPGDIYQHWKGKNYQVILITKDEKTCEDRVVYCPVGQDNAWSRELNEWNDIIDTIEGDPVHRFKFIRNIKDVRKEF